MDSLKLVPPPSSGPIYSLIGYSEFGNPPSKTPPTRSPVGRLAVSVELALAQQEALVLHCVSGRWRRRGGGAALGRGRARAPASPALTTLSGPRPPSRLGPVPRPRPVRPRCPLGRLKPVGQAAWGKLARLRQRRLCEGRGKRGAVHRGGVGAICLGDSRVWGSHLSWRRVWEDLRAGDLTFREPLGVANETVRTSRFGIALGLGEESSSSVEAGMQAGWCPSCL